MASIQKTALRLSGQVDTDEIDTSASEPKPLLLTDGSTTVGEEEKYSNMNEEEKAMAEMERLDAILRENESKIKQMRSARRSEAGSVESKRTRQTSGFLEGKTNEKKQSGEAVGTTETKLPISGGGDVFLTEVHGLQGQDPSYLSISVPSLDVDDNSDAASVRSVPPTPKWAGVEKLFAKVESELHQPVQLGKGYLPPEDELVRMMEIDAKLADLVPKQAKNREKHVTILSASHFQQLIAVSRPMTPRLALAGHGVGSGECEAPGNDHSLIPSSESSLSISSNVSSTFSLWSFSTANTAIPKTVAAPSVSKQKKKKKKKKQSTKGDTEETPKLKEQDMRFQPYAEYLNLFQHMDDDIDVDLDTKEEEEVEETEKDLSIYWESDARRVSREREEVDDSEDEDAAETKARFGVDTQLQNSQCREWRSRLEAIELELNSMVATLSAVEDSPNAEVAE